MVSKTDLAKCVRPGIILTLLLLFSFWSQVIVLFLEHRAPSLFRALPVQFFMWLPQVVFPVRSPFRGFISGRPTIFIWLCIIPIFAWFPRRLNGVQVFLASLATIYVVAVIFRVLI